MNCGHFAPLDGYMLHRVVFHLGSHGLEDQTYTFLEKDKSYMYPTCMPGIGGDGCHHCAVCSKSSHGIAFFSFAMGLVCCPLPFFKA
jgi:hypothetical protein